MVKRVKEYTSEFLHDESGMEFLQLAVVIVIVVSLIGVVMGLRDVIQNNIKTATDKADSEFGNALTNGGGTGGSGGGTGGGGGDTP